MYYDISKFDFEITSEADSMEKYAIIQDDCLEAMQRLAAESIVLFLLIRHTGCVFPGC